jgi:hypothetical protein
MLAQKGSRSTQKIDVDTLLEHAREASDFLKALSHGHNDVPLANLPPEFDGITLLQVSDLHLDINSASAITIRSGLLAHGGHALPPCS